MHFHRVASVILLLICGALGFRLAVDEATSMLTGNESSPPDCETSSEGFPWAEQCAGKWKHRKRYKCDLDLEQFIKKMSPDYDDFVINMKVEKNRKKMSKIAACYMDDDCFKKPREPARMHVSKDPFKQLRGLHYFSYNEWWRGVEEAWRKMRNHPSGSKANRKTLLIVPFFGGAAAGTSGKSNPHFDQELAERPEMFYKSELWMQMHLIHHYAADICGIAFVGRSDKKDRIDPARLEDICEYDENSEKLPEKKRCNFALAFDVTYSGMQLEGDADDMYGKSSKNLLGQRTKGTVVNRADSSRKLVLLGVTHNGWYTEYAKQLEYKHLPYNVILGKNAKTGYSGESKKIPGGKRPLLIPQFKIPDSASLDPEIAKHLQFLLCCCGYDTRRPPYKAYCSFRPTPCEQSKAALSKGRQCDFVRDHCSAMFPSYDRAPNSSQEETSPDSDLDTTVLRVIQDYWWGHKKWSRRELFRRLKTKPTTVLTEEEFVEGMPAVLQEWQEEDPKYKVKVGPTLYRNFDYLCERAPACNPVDPKSGITEEEFSFILDTQ